MPEYSETPVQATRHRRCPAVVITMPYGEPGKVKIVFAEEDVVEIGPVIYKNAMQALEVPYGKDDEFPVTEADGSQTGEMMNHARLIRMLMSLYRHQAELRDAEANPVQLTAPTQTYLDWKS